MLKKNLPQKHKKPFLLTCLDRKKKWGGGGSARENPREANLGKKEGEKGSGGPTKNNGATFSPRGGKGTKGVDVGVALTNKVVQNLQREGEDLP